MFKAILTVLILSFFISCAMRPPELSMDRGLEDEPSLTTSLFKSDQAVLDEESISRILSSKIEIPENAKIGLMKFSSQRGSALRYYGYYYWRSEEYLKLQQSYIDSLTNILKKSDKISEVIPLPDLLTPKEATISILREAAVRIQADMLVIFRITSDIYQKYVFLGRDKVKAFSTCEVILLDVRTGIIPFTTVITQDYSTRKEDIDLNTNETMRRAEREAVVKSIKLVGEKILVFFNPTSRSQ